MTPAFVIAPLTDKHDRKTFSCGKPALDKFLRELASQYARRRLGRTCVLTSPGDLRVLGYYTLASGSLPITVFPARFTKKMPKHAVPVSLLGRLAVDRSTHGRGYGSALLRHALGYVLKAAEFVDSAGVEVTAIDAEAATFYLKYGFAPLSDSDLHLFLPLTTIDIGSDDES